MNRAVQSSDPIRVGLIGAGAFGKTLLSQSRRTSHLSVPVVCDRSIETARQACLAAGIPAARLAAATTVGEASAALEADKVVLVEDVALLLALPLPVVVESTGIPDAGAKHGLAALEAGKHVVMVNKECDAVVGPILGRIADELGLVYTQADGDQPSLLIRLIEWAEGIGLPVVCGGKASVPDMVYSRADNTVRKGARRVQLPDDAWDLWAMPEGASRETIAARRAALHAIPQVLVPDLCEMLLVINSTGYGYDRPTLHAPVARLPEMPDVLCGEAWGGILQQEGVIDIVHCLRRPDEAGLAGGVFIVVAVDDAATSKMLAGKGHLLNRQGNRALLYRPYHLLGVEVATSIYAAALDKTGTGGATMQPRVDLCAKTTEPLRAGQSLGMIADHAIAGVEPLLLPASPLAPDSPIPFYLAAENRLARDVPAGTVLTYGMVDYAADSPLWQLKQRQDAAFLGGR